MLSPILPSFYCSGLRCITLEYWCLVGSVFTRHRRRESQLAYLKKLFDRNNIICLQEVHGKDDFLQAVQVLAPRFRFFGTFLLDSENAGGSAISIHRELLPEEALVTHLITCHGRDHLVNIQSERHSLVIVNVHFEPERTLRQLRGRLGLIHRHWPAYPKGVGVILGDFNICDPEEGPFNVGNQTFTEGDPGKTAVFHSFFRMSLRLPNLTTQEKTVQPLETYALFQGLIGYSSINLWLKYVISTAPLMLMRISGKIFE